MPLTPHDVGVTSYGLFWYVGHKCITNTSVCYSLPFRYEFFNDLYHRFLLTPKIQMKCMCLQAMTIVYGKCHEEIGAFNDTRYIVGMLERVSDTYDRCLANVTRKSAHLMTHDTLWAC